MSTFGDVVGYVFFKNPASKTILNMLGINGKQSQPAMINVQKTLWESAGHNKYLIRMAGIGGVSAIIMHLYGQIHLNRTDYSTDDIIAKSFFDSAYRSHLLHSAVLIAIPLTHRPLLTGSLMISGAILFCSANYYRAFTGKPKYTKIAATGGVVLFLGWLTIIF